MTHPAPAPHGSAVSQDDDETTAQPLARSVRRHILNGTGATLAVAVASVAGAGSAAADEQYTVRSGDTVWHIAARTGTSVDAISTANRLPSSAAISIGQTLTIPTAPRPTAPAAVSSAARYTVASGDTVSTIAAQHGTTVAAIVAANGLDARAFIRAGQELTVPAPGAAPTAAAPASRAAARPSTTSYTVVAGDTVSRIAAKLGSTVAAIVAANGLDARASIRAGQQLVVPGAEATSSPAPAAAASSSTGTYTVRSGDTVGAIASRHGTTVAAIVAANGLDANAFVRVGQSLSLPGAVTAPTSAAPTTTLVGNTFLGRTYSGTVVASANANKASLLAAGAPSRAQMQAKVAATARAMGVDPALAQAIAFQESGFDQTAVSPANAIGTMQCIPSSGEWASQLVGRPLNLLDPDDNVTCGVALLRQLVKVSPDLPSAIAGYYQGAASVRRNGMFPDTRRYVANVQTLMSRYR